MRISFRVNLTLRLTKITPPKPPIQVLALLPKLNENKEIEDLLDWVLDALPNRSLEECFTVIFKILMTYQRTGPVQSA